MGGWVGGVDELTIKLTSASTRVGVEVGLSLAIKGSMDRDSEIISTYNQISRRKLLKSVKKIFVIFLIHNRGLKTNQ